MSDKTPGFVWRYGSLLGTSDLSDLDQWIGKRTMGKEMPDAPAALKEAIENFLTRKDLMKITIYDPPSGWRYGFPRPYSPLYPDEPLKDTLLRDGYPQAEIDWGGDQYVRFWTQEVEESTGTK